ncbi:MAG: hypothetical protein DMG73_02820 [Acidobacteria bacterium]|nr:MAG: hypothetical protein DMG73_02820 [Acidobacteriota bacterium]
MRWNDVRYSKKVVRYLVILASFGVLSFVVEGLSLISGKGEDDGHHKQEHGRRTDQACHQLVLTSNLSLGWPCPKAWGCANVGKNSFGWRDYSIAIKPSEVSALLVVTLFGLSPQSFHPQPLVTDTRQQRGISTATGFFFAAVFPLTTHIRRHGAFIMGLLGHTAFA